MPVNNTAARWDAELSLIFKQVNGRSLLTKRHSFGPLRLLKTLYPEDKEIAHAIVLHPPGGLASGDSLRLNVRVEQGCHVVMTTPGAQKWYRWNESPTDVANSVVDLTIGEAALLEWMPHETLLFNGAVGSQRFTLNISAGGKAFACDTLQLGRTGKGERFNMGQFQQCLTIVHDGALIWSEHALISGGSPLLTELGGFGNYAVTGTIVIVTSSAHDTQKLLASIRAQVQSEQVLWGASAPHELLICIKSLAHESEEIRHFQQQCWKLSRPVLAGKEAILPRIWAT